MWSNVSPRRRFGDPPGALWPEKKTRFAWFWPQNMEIRSWRMGSQWRKCRLTSRRVGDITTGIDWTQRELGFFHQQKKWIHSAKLGVWPYDPNWGCDQWKDWLNSWRSTASTRNQVVRSLQTVDNYIVVVEPGAEPELMPWWDRDWCVSENGEYTVYPQNGDFEWDRWWFVSRFRGIFR